MKKWTPWTIALAAAGFAVVVVLWRQFDWEERKYTAYVAEVSDFAMMQLAEDPLATRPDTQQAVRIVAAAADAGHYVTPESLYALALQLQREGSADQAEALLYDLVTEAPDWSWPYVLLGSIVGRDGPERLGEAEEALRRAIALDPDWARPYNSLGVVLRLMERYGEAEEAFLYALELAPEDIACHNNYANLLLVLGRYEDAEVHYAHAVEMEPDNPKPLYNLACLYSVMERTEDALHFLEAAVSLSEALRREAAVDPYLANLHELPEYRSLVYDDAAPATEDTTVPEQVENVPPEPSNGV